MNKSGVIYYASGEQYIKEAKRSAASLKEHNDIHVTVFTDQSVDTNLFDRVEQIEPGEYPFYDRINHFKQTPYERTLHLDTDTVVVGDIEPVFEMLDRFEIVAAINETRDTASEQHKFETVCINVPKAFPEYQCGVLGFCDTERVIALFEDWQQRYAKFLNDFILDQPFFREAVYHSDVDIGTLPSEYNALLYLGGYFEQKVRIVHLAGTKPKTYRFPFVRYKSDTDAIKTLNESSPQKRVLFYDGWNRLQVRRTYNDVNLLYRIVRSVHHNGVIETVRRVFQKL